MRLTFREVSALGTLLDLVPHVFLGVVRVYARELLRIIKVHKLLTTFLLEGILDIDPLTLRIDPSESVATISVEVPAVRVT